MREKLMDLGRKIPKFCKWKDRPKITMSKEEVEEEVGVRESLLPPSATAGKKKVKKKKNPKRRVQWNDDRGNRLVQVMEFFPSDSSDSDDEYVDSCICTIM